MNSNLSSIPFSQDLQLNIISGREVLYQKLKGIPAIVRQAFEDFQTAFDAAQNKLWKLQHLGEFDCADASLYDLKQHKFISISPDFVTVFSSSYKSSEEKNRVYLRDYLNHHLIPQLARNVMGEEDSEEKQQLQAFIHYKLQAEQCGDWVGKKWADLAEKIRDCSMKSALEKQEQIMFKTSLEGQLAIEKEKLACLLGRTFHLREWFKGINFDLIELRLLNDKNTPAISAHSKELKENLKDILVLLRKEFSSFEELKDVFNGCVVRSIENLLMEWNNLEENQEKAWSWSTPKPIFEVFKESLCKLLKDVEQHRIALENLKWMIEDLTRQVEEQTLQHLLEANDRVKAESDDSILEFVMNTWLDDSFSSVSKESEQMSEVEDLDSSVTLPIDFFDIPAAISLTEDPISLSGLEGNINDEELDVHHIACEREAESPFQVFDLTVVSPEATSQVDRDVSIPANEAAASVPVSDNELARQNVGPAFTSSGRVAELTMERTSTLKSRIVKTFSQFKNYTQRIMLGLWSYVTGWWRQIIR